MNDFKSGDRVVYQPSSKTWFPATVSSVTSDGGLVLNDGYPGGAVLVPPSQLDRVRPDPADADRRALGACLDALAVNLVA